MLEEIDTPILNSILNDIVSTDDIDNALRALTNHITTVFHDSSRTIPTNSNRKELLRDVKELLKAKNAALRQVSKYPTCENRSHARTLHRKVRDRMQKNGKKGVPIPALRKIDNSIAFDDREKAECLADSIEQQCSENPRLTLNILGGWKRRFVAESPFHPKTIWIPSLKTRPNHSCPQQALRLVEYISESFKIKRKTVAVFFDVAKAFDRTLYIGHAGLIHKLYQLELPDRLVIIIYQYISNHHLTFRLDNTYSSVRPIRAGVPQGSTLSPLLYSACVNDVLRPKTGV
ncbi:RNA-directed DNA polymerase from mobile element jockey [Eumeta japonica]|uniref:RNA-directed DNA polymerase from mobile element jockey n=1 Tax=Eumeta variegata TaxID=151549 RepID=A0A4C1UES0_EUMVA|nr:RNA-directed DNA polymerase from mobile element jockey [Eumeta japonica]